MLGATACHKCTLRTRTYATLLLLDRAPADYWYAITLVVVVVDDDDESGIYRSIQANPNIRKTNLNYGASGVSAWVIPLPSTPLTHHQK